jgi:hypothetical protein
VSDLPPLSKQATEFPKGIYQHYKGNRYQILAVGRSSETLEEVVVYQDLDKDRPVWVRPLPMFLETVVINNEEVPRFRLMDQELSHSAKK